VEFPQGRGRATVKKVKSEKVAVKSEEGSREE
jgi:hypothetical protein